jgi:hypothetical protein
MAISAFFMLRRLNDDILGLKAAMFRVMAIVSAMHIKQGFDQIADMKEMLQNCIRTEQYEEAKRIKDMIAAQVAASKKQLETFKELFGDIADINVEEVNLNHQ